MGNAGHHGLICELYAYVDAFTPGVFGLPNYIRSEFEGRPNWQFLVDEGTTAKVKAQHVGLLSNGVGLELQGVRLGWPQRSSTLRVIKDYLGTVRGRGDLGVVVGCRRPGFGHRRRDPPTGSS